MFFRRLNIRSSALFHYTRRSFMPLPPNQTDFIEYPEIDLPAESRIASIQKSGLAKDGWVATEKVHGTNLGVHLLRETEFRFAKRSGLMNPTENFFGYHSIQPQLEEFVRIAHGLLRERLKVPHLSKVILHGELFGSKYDHPDVPKSKAWCKMPNGKSFPMAGVAIQDEPFPQYSPEIHFYCFDIKYAVEDDAKPQLLPFIDFEQICSQVPGLLYAKPLVRGSLDQCLAFDVENFMTPIPSLLGLGNFPLEGNLAEGVVIRHIRRGNPEVDRKNVSTVLKLRCSCFMELKHPNKQKELRETFFETIRKAAVMRAGEPVGLAEAMMPQVEASANALLLNHVSTGRLRNVISKIGRETLQNGSTTREALGQLLTKDALKDFLKEVDERVLNTSVSIRKALVRNCYHESLKLVKAEWSKLIEATSSKH